MDQDKLAPLLSAVTRNQPGAFAAQVQAALLDKSSFKWIADGLKRSPEFQGSRQELLLFLLACVESAACDGFVGAQPVAHLILETVPLPVPRTPEVVGRAAETFLTCCRAEHPRVAIKLAQTFGLELSDLPQPAQSEVAELAAQQLAVGGTASNGVAVLMQFPPLQRGFDVGEVLEELVVGGQLATAGKFAAALGRQHQVHYVNACLAHDHLKSAARAVKDWRLQAEFPDVEGTYRQRTLDRLCSKGLWGVAATYVAEDAALQAMLVRAALLAGEAMLAQEFCQLWGRDFGEFRVTPEALEAERAHRAEAYLQFSLPPERLHFVDTLEGLQAMAAALQEQLSSGSACASRDWLGPLAWAGGSGSGSLAFSGSGSLAASASLDADSAAAAAAGRHVAGAGRGLAHDWAAGRGVHVVGMDCEWRPEQEGQPGGSSPASILQLSTDSDVFLVDLLALGSEPEALSAALGPTLASERVFKLGVGLSSDVRKLGASYPGVAAFRTVHGCLDLSSLWKQRHVSHVAQPAGGGGSNGRRGREMGLSTLCEALLGKPLDKSMQVSDWGRRPLSEAQLRYAALDAHAAVLIFRGLQQLNPAFAAPSGLDPYAFSVLLPPPAPHHKRHWSEAEPSTSGRDKDGGDDGSAGGSSSSGGGGGGGGIGASGPSTGSAGGGSSGVDGMEEDSGGRADGADTWGCQLQQPAQPQLALQPEAEATSLLPPLVAELLRQHSLAASSVVPLQPVPQDAPGGCATLGGASTALEVLSQRARTALGMVETRAGAAALVLARGHLRTSLRKALHLLLAPPPRLLAVPAHLMRVPALRLLA